MRTCYQHLLEALVHTPLFVRVHTCSKCAPESRAKTALGRDTTTLSGTWLPSAAEDKHCGSVAGVQGSRGAR
jgi:hypothetical protein